MMPTRDQIENILNCNIHWRESAKLSISPSSMPVHKIVTLNKIMKDLSILYADDEFGSEVFAMVRPQLANVDWTFKCGTYPLWNSMLSKSKGIAKKTLTGLSGLDTLSKGLVKHGKSKQNEGRRESGRV
jgi:hypothetical protein